MRIALVWPVANALVEENYGLALVLFVIAAVGILPQDIVDALGYIMVVTTVLSGADYVYQFTKRAWDLPPGPVRPVAASAGDAARR